MLGWVRWKEKGCIPTDSSIYIIKSGANSCKAGRYYVSVYVEQPEQVSPQLKDIGLGIDLGVKDFAVISNGIVKKNINKTAKLKKVEKQLKRG